MHYRKTVLRQALKGVNQVGQWYYPNQKALLDDLRTDEYALVVFDALRYDYAQEILPLYLEGELRCAWSAAHDTFQYTQRCWGDKEYPDTYVSGAVPISTELPDHELFDQLYTDFRPSEHLPNLILAWKQAWDESVGTVDPDQLTEIGQQYTDRKKLVVHYFQPHSPYIGRYSLLGHTTGDSAKPFVGSPPDEPIWQAFERGEISSTELRRAYRSNIHRGVEAALPLLEQLCKQNRRVVVMADHGELLGDYRNWWVAHPRVPLPKVRKVPWMAVTGVRDYPESGRQVDGDVVEKLKALGYR